MTDWQPIETAPRDRDRHLPILLAWPNGDVTIGWWKCNMRLESTMPSGYRQHNGDAIDKWLEQDNMTACYFSDTDEMDDYETAKRENQPTHWMTIPPHPDSGGQTESQSP